jgi:hypothetical protein
MGFEVIVVLELIALWAVCGAWLRGRIWADVQQWRREWTDAAIAMRMRPPRDGHPRAPMPAVLDEATVTLDADLGDTPHDASIVATVIHPRFRDHVALRRHVGAPDAKRLAYPGMTLTGDAAFDDLFVAVVDDPLDQIAALAEPQRHRLCDAVGAMQFRFAGGALTLTSSPYAPGTGGMPALDALAHLTRELASWSTLHANLEMQILVALADASPVLRRVARTALEHNPHAPSWTQALPSATVDRLSLLRTLLSRNDFGRAHWRFAMGFHELPTDVRDAIAERAGLRRPSPSSPIPIVATP